MSRNRVNVGWGQHSAYLERGKEVREGREGGTRGLGWGRRKKKWEETGGEGERSEGGKEGEGERGG